MVASMAEQIPTVGPRTVMSSSPIDWVPLRVMKIALQTYSVMEMMQC